MKLRMRKQILAATLCVAMLCGDILPTTASVSSGDAVDETNVEVNTVSDNDLAVPESAPETSETPADGLTVSDGDLAETVLTTEVSGVTITLTAPAGVVPEGTELWAEEINQSARLENINQALEAEEEKKDVEVQKYKAFDIKLLAGGVEIQPTEGVRVSFTGDILLPTSEEENVTVYHVTEDAVANEMAAVVTENAVEMETTHFSVYVIVVENSDSTKTVTFNHYLGTPEKRSRIYAPSTITVESGKILKEDLPLQGGNAYKLVQVMVEGNPNPYVNDDKSNTITEIKLTGAKNVVDLYYEENKNTFVDKTTFYDYYIDGYASENVKIPKDSWANIGAEFTLNDSETKYSAESKFYLKQEWIGADVLKSAQLGLKLPGSYTESIYDLKDGDKLYFADDDVWTFNGTECAFYHVAEVYKYYNGGINEGFSTGHPFLAMGRANKTDAQQGENPEKGDFNVSGHSQFTIKKDNGLLLNFNTNKDSEAGDLGKKKGAIKTGLVSHLDDPNGDKTYPNLVMGKASNDEQILEPGYFTPDTSNNKEIYTNYSLHFNQTGNTYQLDYVQNDAPGKEKDKTYSYNGTALNRDFFPLNQVTPIGGRQSFEPSGWAGGTNNLYFGMRYDFDFKIKDYVGPMTYEFIGDDDMWVFVDGKLALDMGGMHGAYPDEYTYGNSLETDDDPNTVDLWNFLFKFTSEDARLTLTDAQKDEVHTVSILFMERGGDKSSCAMKFVIPNVTDKPSIIPTEPKGSAEFTKVDENGNVLPEAEFGLYDQNDKLVVRATSGDDGKVKFASVDLGDYYVKEITAPKGYKLDTEKYEVTIVANQKALINNGEIKNLPYVGRIEFTKVDGDDNKNKPLKGAEFGLFTTEGVKVATATSDDKGIVRFENVKIGTYYVQELQAPADFVTSKAKHPVTVTDGNTSTVLDGVVYNHRETVDFTIRKQDKNSKEFLPNATFKLSIENGKQFLQTVTSDENGNLNFKDIPLESSNIYYLEEIKAPEGYEIPADPVWQLKVNKNKDGTISVDVHSGPKGSYKDSEQPVIIYNEKDIDITIQKEWLNADGEKDTNPNVDSIQVQLYRQNGTSPKSKVGEPVTLTKETGWTYTFRNVANGDGSEPWVYSVEELNVDGYILSKDIEMKTFTSTNNRTTIAFTLTNRPNVGDLKITKTIDKLNMVYGAASFTFKIEEKRENGEKGLVLYRTITFDEQTGLSRELTVEDIPVGVYTVTELDNIRYTQKEVSVTVGEKENKGVNTAEVTLDSTPIFNFVNEQKTDKYYSHSDIVVNSFRQNSDGNIEVSKNRKVLETKEFEVE